MEVWIAQNVSKFTIDNLLHFSDNVVTVTNRFFFTVPLCMLRVISELLIKAVAMSSINPSSEYKIYKRQRLAIF